MSTEKWTPSPELDKAVGDAIGLNVIVEPLPKLGPDAKHVVMNDESGTPWMPSVYLMDAFFAAESVCPDGFAIHRPHASQVEQHELWHAVVGKGWDQLRGRAVRIFEARGATPALAICRAIMLMVGNE